MRRGQEGKLLAGAADFYSAFLFTLGERTEEQSQRDFATRFLFERQKERFASSAGTAFRLTPIRVREKRMNTR